MFETSKQQPEQQQNNAGITPEKQGEKPGNPHGNCNLAFCIVGVLLDADPAKGLTASQLLEIIHSWGYPFTLIVKGTIHNTLKSFHTSNPFTNLNLNWYPVREGIRRIPAKSYYITFKK